MNFCIRNNALNSTFTYSNHQNNLTNEYFESPSFGRTEESLNIKNGTKFNSEFLHTFNDKTNLQLGYGNTWENRNNRFIANSRTIHFSYSDLRHKIYAYYMWQKNQKFSVKFGGAAETSTPSANGIENSYYIYQPYLDVKYKPSALIDFKAKYRATTNYPDINQRNPFYSFIDQQSFSIGNPVLRPELTHNVSLQTNVLGGLLTVEPFYGFSNNFITQTGKLRSDSIFEYNYNNIGNYRNYGTEGRFTVPLGKSLFVKSNFRVFNSQIKYNDKLNKVNDWTMTSQLIYRNQKTETVALLQYQKGITKNITAQGFSKDGTDYWIFLVQQPLFNEKLTIKGLYLIPTNFGVGYDQGSQIKTDNYKETTFNDISFVKNFFLVELSYRFSKGKSVVNTEKNMDDGERKKSKGLF